MPKKYELTEETKVIFKTTLHRIRALVSFGNVKAGDLGGWIEKEENLSHDGNAWVADQAWAIGNSRITGNSLVADHARVMNDAWLIGDAKVLGNACVIGNARIGDSAVVTDHAVVTGEAVVSGDVTVANYAYVDGNSRIANHTHLLVVGGLGSNNDLITFTRSKSKHINVWCPDFCGTIDKFESHVKETECNPHRMNAYLAAIELAKVHIGDVEEC